ncbi:hypothetical protein DAMNIGENAA_19840 [Desulforhabdus amnigena]|uniref:DUF2335 domain-containing protein n=2 Tax=Desulforhabdus amnigena TaxID=40218 RepID=A0A9W6FTX0_9BACT|nr:hypothetical protein DAMNIGENAA_19840 [Desulforhabdus amnigena]
MTSKNHKDIAKQSRSTASDQNNQLQTKQQLLLGHQYSGPLPHPSILEKYEVLYPGATKLIIDNYLLQTKHRQELEKRVIESGCGDSRKGLWFAFIIGMTGIVGSVACILSGAQIAGSVLGFTSLTGLVSTFIIGTRERRAERETKFKAMQ